MFSEFQRVLFELFSSIENFIAFTGPDIFRSQIVQAFMVLPFIVVSQELSESLVPGRLVNNSIRAEYGFLGSDASVRSCLGAWDDTTCHGLDSVRGPLTSLAIPLKCSMDQYH